MALSKANNNDHHTNPGQKFAMIWIVGKTENRVSNEQSMRRETESEALDFFNVIVGKQPS